MNKIKELGHILWRTIKDYKLFAGIAFLIVIGIIAAICFGLNKGHSVSSPSASDKYKVDENEELVSLILNYYYAYSNGDVEAIKAYTDPISDEEASYIEFYSRYIDAFENVKLYTKKGLTDGSYLVSAYVDLKFANIDTAAPGLDFFYVETNSDGNLYINNLYGSFNQSNNVYEMNPEVTALIAKFETQEDVITLQNQVQQQCDEVVASDETLRGFVEGTLSDAIIAWSTEYQTQLALKAEQEAAAAEEEAKKKAEEEAEANAYYGLVTDTLNVRALASKDGAVVGKVSAGDKVKIYQQEGDYYQIEYDNRKAYIVAEYVKPEKKDEAEDNKPATTETTASNSGTTDSTTASTSTSTTTSSTADKVTVSEKKSYYLEGDKVTVNGNYKVYDSMMSDAKSVGTVYPGQVLTVVFSYEEGYTQIKAGEISGFIRTSNIN